MQYTTILFDLDGTLTDPKVGITKSVQFALRRFGIDVSNLDNLVHFIGPPLFDSFREAYGFSEDEARQAIVYYREYFSTQGIYENQLYPGIPELLSALKTENRCVVMATSKPTVFAEKIAKHFRIAQYFDMIVGSNLDGTRSAKGEIIGYILKQLEPVLRGTVIMVGDRKYDILGAKNQGIDSIGVTYGYGSVEEISRYEPTFTVATVGDLEKTLFDTY